MKTQTYSCLRKLHERFGPQIFGMICQKFVALAFREGGCGHVVERGVQGVDIDAVSHVYGAIAAEIKTTTGDSVLYQEKDARCLAARARDGYRPMLGVLRLGLFSEWCFVEAKLLVPGEHGIANLRPIQCARIGKWLASLFDNVVRQHYCGTLSGAQSYLDEVLRRDGIEPTPDSLDW